MIGDRSPATRRAAAQVVIDLLNYRELFTADRPRRACGPGEGPSAVAPSPRCAAAGRRTRPRQSRDDVLQPLLAAALYR